MRIDLNAGAGPTGDAVAARKAGREAAASAEAAPAADHAQLSSDQAKVQTLSAAVLQLPEVRQQKVAALAAQVQSGGYQVEAQQTAEALLQALTTNRAA